MTAAGDLERVLEDERVAIRRLDGESIERLSSEKARLVAALGDEVVPPDVLARLQAALRRNGALLAHGRACLKDALVVLQSRASLAQHRVL